MSKTTDRKNGAITPMPAPSPLPGTPSAKAALQDVIDGKEPLPHDVTPAAVKVAKPGDRRPANAMDILALRLHDANESIVALRAQSLDQAERIVEQEGVIHNLQRTIAGMERERLTRENNALRNLYGYVSGQTILEENIVTGEFTVVEQQKRAQPGQQPVG